MKLSELIASMVAVLANEGDMRVFSGDMKPVTLEQLDVMETTTTEQAELALTGKKYLHLGDW